MQRRTFAAGAAALVAAPLLRLPTAAQEPSPEAAPAWADIEPATEGLVLTVSRLFRRDFV